MVSLEEPFMDSSQSVDDILMEADSLTESGFTIADSLFGQDAGCFSVQSLDSDVRATAIEKMGLVYLVEYSVEEYMSIDSAKISLEKTLDNLGFNVRLRHGNTQNVRAWNRNCCRMFHLKIFTTTNVGLWDD